jgi:hypothetical protein
MTDHLAEAERHLGYVKESCGKLVEGSHEKRAIGHLWYAFRGLIEHLRSLAPRVEGERGLPRCLSCGSLDLDGIWCKVCRGEREQPPAKAEVPSPNPKTMWELHEVCAWLIREGYIPKTDPDRVATLHIAGMAWDVSPTWFIDTEYQATLGAYTIDVRAMRTELEKQARYVATAKPLTEPSPDAAGEVSDEELVNIECRAFAATANPHDGRKALYNAGKEAGRASLAAELRAKDERLMELEAKLAAWAPVVVAADVLRTAKTAEYDDAAFSVIANVSAIPPKLRAIPAVKG